MVIVRIRVKLWLGLQFDPNNCLAPTLTPTLMLTFNTNLPNYIIGLLELTANKKNRCLDTTLVRSSKHHPDWGQLGIHFCYLSTNMFPAT